MTNHNGLASVGIWLHAGSGTSAVTGRRLAFFGDSDAYEFFELLARADHGWDDLVRTLAKQIAGRGYDHPPIALFELLETGTACFVFGDVKVEVTTTNDTLSLGTQNVSTWLETQVRESVQHITVGQVDDDEIGMLRDGYVSSGGFRAEVKSCATAPQVSETQVAETQVAETQVAETRVAETQVAETEVAETEVAETHIASEAEPEAESVQFDPTMTTAITGAQLSAIKKEAGIPADTRRSSVAGESGDPTFVRPTLRGIRCETGHLNSMQDGVCRTCGNNVDRSGAIEDDERPALAIITFDDGTEFELDQPMAIGRTVPEPYSIGNEVAIPVSLSDESNMISRVHLEIHLSGWDIELIDKGSSNGTFSRAIDATGTKTRLRPEYPTAIPLGTEIEVGGRSFRITAGPMPG